MSSNHAAIEKMVVGKIDLVNFTHFWTITSFSNFYNEIIAKEITSPEFPIDQYNTAYLSLEINDPNNDHLKEFISLHIFLNSYVDRRFRIQYKVSVLSSDKTAMLPFIGMCILSNDFGYGNNYYIKKAELMNDLKDTLLPNDELTVMSEITILDQIENVQLEGYSKQFKILFGNKDFTDMTLCIDGKEINVHKVVLASKSEVFYNMIEEKEKSDHSYEYQYILTDVSYNVLTELLRFIYTGHVENLQDLSKDLLIAADKYCISKLKDMCENYIVSSVSLESAAEMIIFAELFNAGLLEEYIKDLIKENVKEFIKTPGFLNFKKSHSTVLLELLCDAIEELNID